MSQRSTVSQRIASEIHSQILRRRYNPGERLPTERELAVHYGVSRIPVREAMKILEQRGIIETRHGSGNYVTSIDEEKIIEQISQYIMLCTTDMNDLGAFWRMLENYTVTSAAMHRTQEQCGQIRRLADDCAAEIRSALAGQPYNFNESDYALHSAIAKASDNKIAANLVSAFHESLRVRQSIVGTRAEELSRLIGIHDAIVKGIERQDPEMAARAMREDLSMGTDLMNELKQKYRMSEIFL